MTANIASTIINAIARGYSARTILNYITRNNPQYSNVINNALAMGYTADAILKRISDKSGKNPDDTSDYLTDSEKTDKADKAAKRRAAIGVGAGAAALGAVGLGAGLSGLAGRAAKPAVELLPALGSPQLTYEQPIIDIPNKQIPLNQPKLPGPPEPLQPGPTLGLQMQQQAQAPVQQAIQPTPPQQTAQAAQAPIPTPQPMQPIIPASKVLQDFGALRQVHNMLDTGTPTATIAAVVNSMLKGDKRKEFQQMLKSGQIKPLEEMVRDVQAEREQAIKLPYSPMQQQNEVATNLAQENVATNLMQEQAPEQIQPPEIKQSLQQEPEPQKPIEKKSLVATSEGMGEVKAISGDKAMVEINGKARPVPIDELIQSPIPEKELSQLFDDMKAGIERETGQEISRMVEFAGYDPNNNELLFVPWNGGGYVYKDLSPEQARRAQSLLGRRKTTGSNFIGTWEEGTHSPAGAEMSALIRELQKERGGKGNEYSGKFETVYKAIEPAILASKEAEAQRKKAAKEKPSEKVTKKVTEQSTKDKIKPVEIESLKTSPQSNYNFSEIKKGSQKQIDWAKKIRNDWVELLKSEYENLMERQKYKDYPDEFFNESTKIYKNLLKKVSEIDDAKKIIEVNVHSNASYVSSKFRSLYMELWNNLSNKYKLENGKWEKK